MNRPWTPEDEQRVVTLRASGMKWIVIASRLGRTEASVVGRYLKKLRKEKITGEGDTKAAPLRVKSKPLCPHFRDPAATVAARRCASERCASVTLASCQGASASNGRVGFRNVIESFRYSRALAAAYPAAMPSPSGASRRRTRRR